MVFQYASFDLTRLCKRRNSVAPHGDRTGCEYHPTALRFFHLYSIVQCKKLMDVIVDQDYKDRRKHQRVEVTQAIFIEVVNRRSRSESENTIIRCETVDVSVGGLKIYVSKSIAMGSRLNIAVPMEGWKENLELAGEAVWVRPAEGKEGFWVGLELRDSNRENMEKWFRVVHSLSSTPPQ